MTPSRGRLVRDQRGSSSIEATILVPVILILITIVIAGGRMALTRTNVENAARAAARAASLEHDGVAANRVADQIARANLTSGGVACADTSIVTDTTGYRVAVGIPTTVSVTVSCTIGLGDLLIPGLGGSRTFTETVTVPLDSYRSRGVPR